MAGIDRGYMNSYRLENVQQLQ